jgi:hypothetical protein
LQLVLGHAPKLEAPQKASKLLAFFISTVPSVVLFGW